MKSELYQCSEEELQDFDHLYDGTFSEEEYYLIKAKMQLDEVLQHKYLVYKMLRNEIEQDGLSNRVLKSRLLELDRKRQQSKKAFFSLAIFAAVACALILMLQLNRVDNKVALYHQYKDAESGLTIPMAEAHDSPLAAAMIAIANEQYEQGIHALAKCTATDTTLYYWAYCQERLSADQSALKAYVKLTQSHSLTIKHKSEFRIALLHVKHNAANASIELQHIAQDPENPYNKLAQELITSMNKR